jgi:hypothetical protein
MHTMPIQRLLSCRAKQLKQHARSILHAQEYGARGQLITWSDMDQNITPAIKLAYLVHAKWLAAVRYHLIHPL